MTKPLITLCMIVKDEAHGIARTLQSAKPWIDRWCILDTGSTDGTQKIVRDVMTEEPGGVLGMLREIPFVDFSQARNALLTEAAKGSAGGFLLLLDADDILEGGEALRAWCESEYEREAFFVRTRLGSAAFASARVVRASAVGPDAWHFVGAIHEVLVHPSGRAPTVTIPGVTIRHVRQPESEERTRARWERDAELLFEETDRDPNNARAWFYLARTYQGLDNFAAARAAFHARIDLGGWREEVFLSKLDLARYREGDEQIAGLLDAAAFAPHRAEPLIDLANIYRNRGAHRLAFMFAREAWRLPYPESDTLFVDADAHGWSAADCVAISAWYCGEHKIGREAAREALAKCPPEHRDRCARTLAFYENKTP